MFEAVVHDGPLAGLPAHRVVAHPHTAVPLLRQHQPQVGPQPGVGRTSVRRDPALWWIFICDLDLIGGSLENTPGARVHQGEACLALRAAAGLGELLHHATGEHGVAAHLGLAGGRGEGNTSNWYLAPPACRPCQPSPARIHRPASSVLHQFPPLVPDHLPALLDLVERRRNARPGVGNLPDRPGPQPRHRVDRTLQISLNSKPHLCAGVTSGAPAAWRGRPRLPHPRCISPPAARESPARPPEQQ